VDDAINARTRERVRAEVLVQRRGWRAQDFICPGCGNPVRLRSGKQRVSHFAHLPGYDTAGCSYYHGGYAGGGGGGVWEAEPPPLPLYLEVRTGVSGEPIWTIELAIPRMNSPRGRITVVDGLSGRVTLSCAALEDRGRRVRVRPQVSEYRIEVSSEVSDEDADRVLVGSPGLENGAPSLFRAGLNGGRRLLEDDDLTWGESYYAIWDASEPPEFAARVPRQELVSLDARYRGGVFDLPLEADEEVGEWLRNALHRRVREPGVTLTVVSPLALPGPDEELAVDSKEEVVVALRSPGGTHSLRYLVVVDEATGLVRRVPLQYGAQVLFVSIGALTERRVTITPEDYEGAREVELTLVGTKRPMRLTAGAVELVAIDAERQTTTLPLHSRAAAGLLARIRDGGAALDDVRFPPSVPCQLMVSGRDQRVVLAIDPERRRELISVAKQLLSEGRAFAIEAQAFGKVAVPARRIAAIATDHLRKLSNFCRQRIRALAAIARSERSSGNAAYLEPESRRRLTRIAAGLQASDATLLGEFAALRWTSRALPQVRVLTRKILQQSRRLREKAAKPRE
jgi:hypothetical protein